MSQGELADRSGIATGLMSMVENDRVSATSEMIDALAEVLDCSSDYLRTAGDDIIVGRPWLRAYADAPSRVVERVIADSSTAMDMVRRLNLQLVPDILPAYDGDPNDEAEIENFANEVRAAAGLNEGAVVRNMVRSAERLGAVVLPMDGELGRHLGLSTRVDGVPVIRVARSNTRLEPSIPGDRQRFTVAHELGHLTLHHDRRPPDSAAEGVRVEKQAHRFAAAFLAPADALMADLERFGGRVTLGTLAQLKEVWGVAIKMLVVRFQNLGEIDDDQARSLYKQVSARRWNKNEPVDVPNESSVWLEKAISRRFDGARTPLVSAARACGLGDGYFERWTVWEVDEDPESVAPLVAFDGRVRSRTEVRSARDGGRVTRLPVRAGSV